MATAVDSTQSITSLDQLTANLNATKAEEVKKKNEIGEDAFLKMLVEQLKHQDPTDPVKNDELAVNLAQFSQVNELVKINQKLDEGGISDSASLAAFLGREVLVDGDTVDVKAGNGGSVFFELPTATVGTTLQVVDAGGSVVAEKDLGALNSGRQVVSLSGLDISNGSYKVRVDGLSASGERLSPAMSTGGVVTGFIPGADPTLLVGDKEVKASEIRMVNTPTVVPQ